MAQRAFRRRRQTADRDRIDHVPALVHVEIGDTRRCGQWIDLRDLGVDAEHIAAAIRDSSPDSASGADAASAPVVRGPTPGPLWESIGTVRPETTIDLRSALVTSAKLHGHESPHASELVTVREELAALSVDGCDAAAARRAVAAAGDAERELDERVATLRGRLQERPESDEIAQSLDDAVQELSERRTERIAAEQRLERKRERARTLRNRRGRRLQLQDRERNLERAVRADLVESIYPTFLDALGAIPGTTAGVSDPTKQAGADAALALARLSPDPSPVVLGVDRFPSPATAARWLGRPVLRV
ncbi:hypothetical protein SAMN06269185_2276 [Natronoarchaeum philippinense]|uniref:Uncharacterized protein n=1 Tax=Natronoarchaeum philippinense TaxID=558529 RepID=A0A285NZI4_NATPI|nr:hypothetical protein [Natronoarchaeum philippinense]SNZ14849.1 hypothetical protein SAMN06269185_2276 [Natronoarchaeum philippinense]